MISANASAAEWRLEGCAIPAGRGRRAGGSDAWLPGVATETLQQLPRKTSQRFARRQPRWGKGRVSAGSYSGDESLVQTHVRWVFFEAAAELLPQVKKNKKPRRNHP